MLENSIATYVQIDVMPILTLILLYLNAKTNFSCFINIRRFRVLILLIIGILFTDGINWYVQENPQLYSNIAMWSVNIIYFCLTELISYMWFLYVVHQIYGETINQTRKSHLTASVIPLLAICFIIVLSPLNQMIFYIDQNNIYHRGNFHLLQVIVGFGYMIAASILSLHHRKVEEQPERKKECTFLAVVILLPLIGGILQIYNYYMILLWPFSTIAVFLLYTNFQHTKISLDNLTGLNNRGHLEQYLQEKCQEKGKNWYLFFIDIDKFKEINDTYGHTQGDYALCIMADALRETFGIGNAFLARYGGDEFAVVMHKDNDYEAEQIIAKLNLTLEHKNQTGKQAFKLRVSVGYAKWDADIMNSFDDITSLADQQMYEQKLRNKKAPKTL